MKCQRCQLSLVRDLQKKGVASIHIISPMSAHAVLLPWVVVSCLFLIRFIYLHPTPKL